MRAGRLVALMSLLQSQGRLTGADLAARLEVSRRTVLGDIEALSEAGRAPMTRYTDPAVGSRCSISRRRFRLRASGWRAPRRQPRRARA